MRDFLKWILFFILISSALLLVLCTESNNMIIVNENDLNQQTFKSTSSDPLDLPEFVDVNYIELDKIHRISKFRSGEGHDYSDDFESCRSMKHYFQPDSSVDWSLIKIYSPVSGVIVRLYEEWAGTQLQIQSSKYPDFTFIIFHVNLSNPLNEGDVVEYEITDGPKGPQASNVIVTQAAPKRQFRNNRGF